MRKNIRFIEMPATLLRASLLITLLITLPAFSFGQKKTKLKAQSKAEKKEIRLIKKSRIEITLKKGIKVKGALVLLRENNLAVWTNISDSAWRDKKLRTWNYLPVDTIWRIQQVNRKVWKYAAIGAITGLLVARYVFIPNREPVVPYLGSMLAFGLGGASIAGPLGFDYPIQGKQEALKSYYNKLKLIVYTQ